MTTPSPALLASPESPVSIAPDGERISIPPLEEREAAFEQVRARAQNKRVVVVQGLGFVGTAVAAVISAARDARGEPRYLVLGVDLATPAAYWKIARLNAGEVPFGSPDKELEILIRQGVKEVGNLVATSSEEAYALAEAIVVDVHLDVVDPRTQVPGEIDVDLRSFEAAIRTVGKRMSAEALVLIETTVPIGTTEKVVLPLLRAEREHRGIHGPVRLAHAAERVMPGPNYVRSIRNFWRSFAAIDTESRTRAREFLASYIDTHSFPTCSLPDVNGSELGKLLENSYRAMNIAFIQEWALLAEDVGVDLWSVIDGIRVRKGTHDNIRYPGFGVGGYCLTKDSLLAQWAARNHFGSSQVLELTLEALRINRKMPVHAVRLLQSLWGDNPGPRRALICGVSYLAEVADTRNSPTEHALDALRAAGIDVQVHDPILQRWPERDDVPFVEDLAQALPGFDGLILAVPHRAYRERICDAISPNMVVVDAVNVLSDAQAAALRDKGCRLAGVGKGHWRRLGYHLPK